MSPEFDAIGRYWYSSFNTTMDLSTVFISVIYQKLTDAENKNKEQKFEYGMEYFSSESVATIEQAFRWVIDAYNLKSHFKQMFIDGKSHPNLATVRFNFIALGNSIVHRGLIIILKISAKDRTRD